jgi:hypothetical protein
MKGDPHEWCGAAGHLDERKKISGDPSSINTILVEFDPQNQGVPGDVRVHGARISVVRSAEHLILIVDRF